MNGEIELFLSPENSLQCKTLWLKCEDEEDYNIISYFLEKLEIENTYNIEQDIKFKHLALEFDKPYIYSGWHEDEQIDINEAKKLNINLSELVELMRPEDGSWCDTLEDFLQGNFFEKYIIETTQEAKPKPKSKKEILNETPNENENKNLNNKNERGTNMKTNNLFNGAMKNMKFGKIETDEIKYSFKGIAYKTNDDGYVCYNTETEELIDVNQMVFDMPIMVMPLAKKDLKTGDIIQHNNQFVIVKEIKDKSIDAIKPNVQEIIQIIPSKSIFGFDFYSKVVNVFENISTDANQDNPFGNILPMLMMSSKEDSDMSSMLPMLMMNNNSNLDMNSMLPLMMMGGDNNDMMSTFMMMQMLNKK